jgi:hypothetical protein
MLQLQTLGVNFQSALPTHDIERDVPITTRVTLPNLRWFGFMGASAYLETVLSRLTAPILEKLQVDFFNQLTISIPNTQQLISSTRNLRFTSAELRFHRNLVGLSIYPGEETRMYALYMGVLGQHHDWQVSSAAQITSALGPVFSTVVDLSLHLDYQFTPSPERHNEADRTHWREVLRSFNNVKTLHVPNGLLGDLSRSIQLRDGESPMELLPELKELRYDAGSVDDDAFVPFLDVRRNAGHPFTLAPISVRPTGRVYRPRPYIRRSLTSSIPLP